MMRKALLALLVMIPAAPAVAADRPADFDRWFVVRIQGQRAGWMHLTERRADKRITTRQRMNLSIRRVNAEINVTVSMRFKETADGEPISARLTRKMGGGQVVTRYRFDGDERATMVRREGERTRRRRIGPFEKDWLPPAAARRYIAERIDQNAERFRLSAFEPATSGKPYRLTVRVKGRETIDLFGRRVRAVHHELTSSALPGAKLTEYTDERGRMLRSTMRFGGLTLEVVAADKQLARRNVNPPELVAGMLVEPGFTLLEPRSLRSATYRLHVADGDLPRISESTVQRVERIDGQTARVRVDLERDAKPAADDDAPKVEHTTMIDGSDSRIGALADEALAELPDNASPAERAEAMRRHVFGHMREVNLSVGLASASQVAETGRGDCTEHAVLLAAMLQAKGIPARVATGLIYADRFAGQRGVFGYHMWTQAWVEGRWVDLDATLGPDTAFDAAHVLLDTSRMKPGYSTNSLIKLAPLMGRLSVELESAG